MGAINLYLDSQVCFKTDVMHPPYHADINMAKLKYSYVQKKVLQKGPEIKKFFKVYNS